MKANGKKPFVITFTLMFRAVSVLALAALVFNMVLHLRDDGTFITFFTEQPFWATWLVAMFLWLFAGLFSSEEDYESPDPDEQVKEADE
ncbi:MAG: hypothetical protein FWC07_12615 [Defluviitaleaceae bacterium]|nr:hypothetical protein [Defluviitaleaceae bacterium]